MRTMSNAVILFKAMSHSIIELSTILLDGKTNMAGGASLLFFCLG